MTAGLDCGQLREQVRQAWADDILQRLVDYVTIPAKSPHFDPHWAESGHIDRAVALARGWCESRAVPGARVDVVRLPGRTPVLVVEVDGTAPGNVLLYGHLDKQPEMTGWDADKGPWTPVLEDGRLYGRGGADDGYAVFAALTAIEALHRQQAPCPRCLILVETCEESGSYDLPAYMETLAERIGNPGLVICLDSGCGDYDRLWLTSSLRGMAAGDLTVEVLEEGVHSGDAGGVVPCSFRLARLLLSRLEDPATGAIRLAELQAEPGPERQEEIEHAAQVLGQSVSRRFPWAAGIEPPAEDPSEIILARTWRPALAVTGADGLPPLESAGNALRPATTLRLALRLPPTVDGEAASRALKSLFETDPPPGCRVRFRTSWGATGWEAPPLQQWLREAVDEASRISFGAGAAAMGEGGSIPFMGMLGRRFPQAQFLITGVLGPGANAHGPNEFLHLASAERLTAAVAVVLNRASANL